MSLQVSRDLLEACAFRNCKKLVSVTFAQNSRLKSIGKCCFSGSPIKEIVIPSSIESISRTAFHGCHHMRKISISKPKNCLKSSVKANEYIIYGLMSVGIDGNTCKLIITRNYHITLTLVNFPPQIINNIKPPYK